MMSSRTLRALGITLAVAIIGAVAASAATSAQNATVIRIWADNDRKAAVQKVAGEWAASKGVEVEVVLKDFGRIRDDLKTVAVENAPDVIVGAHDWTGQLAADGLVQPIFPSKAVRAKIPAYALNAFSYGIASKRLYGAPVALENLGLIVNKNLTRIPKTFAQLQAYALAFQKKSADNIGLAVPQGTNGDAYHMYPFFSGLCGVSQSRRSAQSGVPAVCPDGAKRSGKIS